MIFAGYHLDLNRIMQLPTGSGLKKKKPKKKQLRGGRIPPSNYVTDDPETMDDDGDIQFVIYNQHNINIQLLLPQDNAWLGIPTRFIPEVSYPQIDMLCNLYTMLHGMNDFTIPEWRDHIQNCMRYPAWIEQSRQFYNNLNFYWNAMRQNFHMMFVPSQIRANLINNLMANNFTRAKLQILCNELDLNFSVFNT